MSIIETESLEQLSELIGGDESALHELIGIFIEEGAEIVAEMKKSLATEELDVLRRSAHSLKSSAQDFGATQLSASTATLESLCIDGWPVNAASITVEISQHFSEAQAELERYLNNK